MMATALAYVHRLYPSNALLSTQGVHLGIDALEVAKKHITVTVRARFRVQQLQQECNEWCNEGATSASRTQQLQPIC